MQDLAHKSELTVRPERVIVLPEANSGLPLKGFERMARRRFQRGQLLLRGTRNPVWIGRWREDIITDGKVKRVQRWETLGTKEDYPTRKLALRALEERLANINNLAYRPRPVATFSEFADKWQRLVLPNLKPSSQPPIRSQLRKHLLPAFGTVAMKDLSSELVQSFATGCDVKPDNLIATLRMMWNSARLWDYVAHDPFDGLVLREWRKQEQRFFTIEEMGRIIDAAQEPYTTFYWLAAETGMRASELCALRWNDLDTDSCFVQVRNGVWRGRLHSVKSKSGERRFAVSPQLAARLALRLEGKTGEQFVFESSRGTPWDPNLVVKRKLYPLLDALGVERAGLHAFRHGNETAMDRMKVPVALRLGRLGHADPRMMVNYSHIIGEDDRKLAAEFGRILCASVRKLQEEALTLETQGLVIQ
jgi:integrase